jgi:hypothetical protein
VEGGGVLVGRSAGGLSRSADYCGGREEGDQLRSAPRAGEEASMGTRWLDLNPKGPRKAPDR